MFLERGNFDTDADVRFRVTLSLTLRNRGHVRLGLLDRHARLQARDDVDEIGVASSAFSGVEGNWRPDLSACTGKSETAGHDTDDGVGLVAHRDRPPNRIRIARETVLPEFVAQDHDSIATVAVFLGGEVAAQRRLTAEQLKEIGGDARADHPFGFIRASEIQPLTDIGGYMRED